MHLYLLYKEVENMLRFFKIVGVMVERCKIMSLVKT